MPDIFLSYAREEFERVSPLIQALESYGWEVWWDSKIPPGQQYNQAIMAALREARCVLVVWSHASVESPWVQDEATRGRDRGILIPAQIDEMELPLGFGMYQTAQLTMWQGDTADAEFTKVMREVTRLIGPPVQPEETVPTPEPQLVEEETVAIPFDESSVVDPRPAPQAVEPETPEHSRFGSRWVWLVVALGMVAVGLYITGPFESFQVAEPPERAVELAQEKKTAEPDKNSIGMEFVRIKAGTFLMGSTAPGADGDEQPVCRVRISKPFDLSKFEVTQAQWKAVMGDNKNPSNFEGDDRPVELVSWNDVQNFIRELNKKEDTGAYRLPTEAEWEYAARAGSETAYHFGDDANQLGEYAWYRENSGNKTHPVGQKKPNEWGLHDMYGNVREWVSDWHGKYPTATAETAVIDPVGPDSGTGRVLRGGSWLNGARYCRSANRSGGPPGSAHHIAGFRLLREVQ